MSNVIIVVRTSPFSVRLTSDVRDMLENHARLLKLKPSVLAAMILRDCAEKWVKDYANEIYKIFGGENDK